MIVRIAILLLFACPALAQPAGPATETAPPAKTTAETSQKGEANPKAGTNPKTKTDPKVKTKAKADPKTAAKGPTKPAKVTNYDFEDDVIEGKTVKPNSKLDQVRGKKGSKSLIQLRTNFDDRSKVDPESL